MKNQHVANTWHRLSEIENNLLGLEPYHIAQIRANTHLTPEVVCFGHVLFEMTVGQPFSGTETDLTGVKGVCPPEVYEVRVQLCYYIILVITPLQILHSIFVRREGAEVPSIKSLMAHSYFAVDMTRLTTGMKWDGKSKTIIKAATGLCTAMYASAGGATENDSNNVPPVTVTSPSTKPSKKSKATADGTYQHCNLSCTGPYSRCHNQICRALVHRVTSSRLQTATSAGLWLQVS
jgi:hypothetical protein